MKLTKSKLKRIIKEELAFLGALETELNFAKKHGLLEEEEREQYPEDPGRGYSWEQEKEDRNRREAAGYLPIAFELTKDEAEYVLAALDDLEDGVPAEEAALLADTRAIFMDVLYGA
jgi:hypothetical protein